MAEQLILTQAHLTELETYLKDQPWKFANPIFVFLNVVKQQQLAAEQAQQAQQAEQAKLAPTAPATPEDNP